MLLSWLSHPVGMVFGKFGFCFSLGGNCNCQFDDGERPPVINWFESAPYAPPSRYHNSLFEVIGVEFSV